MMAQQQRQGVSWEELNRLYDGAPRRDILDGDTTHAVSPVGDVIGVSDTVPPVLRIPGRESPTTLSRRSPGIGDRHRGIGGRHRRNELRM